MEHTEIVFSVCSVRPVFSVLKNSSGGAMDTPANTFRESTQWSTPIRDLGLTIAGTRLEPILAEFKRQVDAAGIRRLRPHFYLSTEWGVGFGTIAIAIPFYLARPDLIAVHA